MSDSPFEIKQSPGRGQGMFATRGIAVGELVLAESPLIVRTGYTIKPGTNEPELVFEPTLNELAPEQRALFFSFMDGFSPDSPTTLGIWRTNSIPLGNGNGGFFANICRINHSCLPNARYSWESEQRRLKLYAMLPIAKGEEILTSYIDGYASRSTRQAFFREHWHFTCTCKGCDVPSSAASDARRARIAELAEIVPSSNENDPVLGYELAKKQIRLLDDEGLADQTRKAELHRQAAILCSFAYDLAAIGRESSLAFGNSVIGHGEQSKSAILIRMLLQRGEGVPLPRGAVKKNIPMLCDACGPIGKMFCPGCSCTVYCDATCAKEHEKWHGPVCRAIRDAQNK